MNTIGFKLLKIALEDAVKKQRFIDEELKALPEELKARKLVAEQTHFLEETITLLNRIG
jgi:DNA-binding MurR/RpiR family transcriptional regulator